ncbi:unnamed protein product [Scytosiphon promiscuus]
MSVASVGVRLSDDFENLPLFETPPLNGPTNQIGTAVKGASLRAVEKQGDFILLEADSEDGSGGGTLGWADASCVVPTSFPALYEFASDLPDAVSLVVRASPKAGAGELGKVFGKGSLVMATGMQGDYISMAHQDRDDSAAPPLRGWMLTATDDRVLLSVKPAFLVVPAPGLPDGVQLRVRAAPEGTAAEVRQVPAAPGTIFEVAEQAGEWLRVLMGDAPSAWMSSAAQGMPLLRPARKDLFVMDPALIAQHGDGVKLAVRNAPSTEGVPLGEITSRGRVYCVGTRGPWLRVLYHGHREAWMLSQTPTAQLLVPAASISASSRSKPPAAAHSAPKPKAKPEAKAKAAPPSRRDGNSRYMVCARRVTVRQFPEFYAQDVGVVLEGAVVRVFEEKEEINEAKQTKDVWVRGESPNTAAAAGSSAGLVEGWLLAFSTKRGAMVADAADALAAQHTFEKQVRLLAASKEKTRLGGPSYPGKASRESYLAGRASRKNLARRYSKKSYSAAGHLKVREEADPLSLELSTVSRGELVKVEETSGLWVRVLYRGRRDGWVLTANKRGSMLSPAEAGPAAAAQEFQAQESAAASGADAANSAATAEEDRPLTGAKGGTKEDAHGFSNDTRCLSTLAASGTSGFSGDRGGSKPIAAGGSAGGPAAGAGGAVLQFMTALGFVKVREEADPFSMDLGSVKKGDIVKVLETSELWARVSYRGREDGWVLTANKRGPTLTPSEDQASAAKEFDAQEAAYAATAANTDGALPEDPADRPLTGAKPPPAAAAAADSSGAASEDRPLTGGGKGAWVPPSEFPPGHEEGVSSSGGAGGGGPNPKEAAKSLAVSAGSASGSPEGAGGSAQYMAALGFVKVREEADPFSMDLGSVKKGDIVKVLETSELWARVSYRGREDGWVLTANKRGPTLVPSEDQASAAGEFDAQEAAYAATAANTDGALPEDPADRPLTGAKPPPAAAAAGDSSAAASEDRPLTGGGKGAWVPPSEFPPGHEEGVSSSAGGGGGSGGGPSEMKPKEAVTGVAASAGSADGSSAGAVGDARYMAALGFVKVREEADPFSMDLGSVKKGDIVKVLETSEKWVRVSYRGREDGWVLTANKRGPTLTPSEDQASAAGEFDAQEAAFAAAAASTDGALPEDPADRPLTGAKPPPAAAAAADSSGAASEDRPLTGGGKGAWVPPSEFPPGHEEGLSPSGVGGGSSSGDAPETKAKAEPGGVVAAAGTVGGSSEDGVGSAQYIAALGFVKVREEADPFSMDLGSVKKGDIVKVLETSKLWARVSYRGREDGWVLTANKRGQTFTPSEDQASAVAEFDAQEAAFAAAAAATDGALPEDPADRPLTGAKPPPAAAAAAAASEDRPLTGGGKGAWVPPSEFPPGHDEGVGGAGGGGSGGDVPEMEAKAAPAPDDTVAVAGSAGGSSEDADGSAKYMAALGFVKVREEADPFSMDLGSVKKGDIVKVLETSKLWARVSYRGREDGWVLTANKRGPTLVPSEDQASAAGEFDAQEAAFAAAAASTNGALPEDPADRPLTGAKPPPPAAAAAEESAASEDRPLTGVGKGAWVPPSEFPPGHEEKVGGAGGGDDASGLKPQGAREDGGGAAGAVGGVSEDAGGSAQYMTALGFVKVREEADPFSMDLGSVKKGDIVKVLETSELWARVSYRGREDGWVLTANKRGPTLTPSEDQASAAGEFDAQEAAFAAAAANTDGALPEDPADRPLTGAKPPPAAAAPADSSGAASEDRPLTGGGKGAWVPPSEFPPGHEEGLDSSAGGSDAGGVKTRITKPDPEDERPSPTSAGEKEAAVGGGGDAHAGNDSGTAQYMTALGMIKLREEADPFSMDLGALKKGDVVKVLEMDGLWARVGYRGKTDGWVLTANKRGAMLAAADSQEEAAATWSEQERQASKHDGQGDPPAAGDDRPIGGKRPAQPAAEYGSDRGVDNDGAEVLATAAAAAAAASSAPGAEGSAVDGLDGNVSPSASATEAAGGAGLKPWQRRKKPPVSRKLAAEKAEEGSAADGAQSAEAAPPAKPWQRKKTAGTGAAGSAAEAVGAAEGGVLDDGRQAGGGAAAGADSVKPWLRKKRPGGATAAPINVGSGGEGGDDASAAVAAKPWKAAAAKAKADGGTVQGAAPGGAGADHGEEGSVEGLEECLEERDWKKRVAAFEAASRACRNGGGGAAATVGPLLPRMLQDKNVQAVDAAVETLGAYLSLRSTMGADEGATLASALAERALCCGKGSVESKADTAADALLGGGSGDLARRGAWLALAARAGGLENEFFPPPPLVRWVGCVGGAGAGRRGVGVDCRGRLGVCECAAVACSKSLGVRWGATVCCGGLSTLSTQVYTAAKSMLGSSKLPVKMAGVSLAAALYAAEGSGAIADLGVEDMESRIKAQLERAFADADAAAKTAAVEDTSSAVHPQTEALDPPPSPPIRPQTTPRNGGVGTARGSPAEGPADVAAAAVGGSGGISSISTDGSGSLGLPTGRPSTICARRTARSRARGTTTTTARPDAGTPPGHPPAPASRRRRSPRWTTQPTRRRRRPRPTSRTCG